jgi:hypothetical protein
MWLHSIVRLLRNAAKYLADQPETVTAAQSKRSAGGPYIQRDGMTNPDNFVEHRKALMKLSVQAIHGKTTGRGTGVIDTIHLVEVARAIPLLADAASLSPADLAAAKKWFVNCRPIARTV